MNWKQWSLILRVLVAAVLGVVLLRWAMSALKAGEGLGLRFDVAFALVIALVLYGVLLWVFFGIPIIQKAGEKAASLYLGDESQMRIMPEYSTAEARVKAGRYAEAVEEYRQVIAQHPEDVYAHIRIAELAVERLNDVKLAELELMSAYAKATTEDATVMAAGRLADLYQNTLQNPTQAIAVMRQLQSRLPETKHVLGAQQRIDALERVKAGHTVPAVPTKIAFKPTDEETLRRRRGY